MILPETIFVVSSHPISFQTLQCSGPALHSISHPGHVLLCLCIFVKALSSPWNVLPGLFYHNLSQGPLL